MLYIGPDCYSIGLLLYCPTISDAKSLTFYWPTVSRYKPARYSIGKPGWVI